MTIFTPFKVLNRRLLHHIHLDRNLVDLCESRRRQHCLDIKGMWSTMLKTEKSRDPASNGSWKVERGPSIT
jgi:hypothetical protein